MSLLDPVLIAQLGNLELRARRILDGFYAGRHVNRNRGHAQDFSEHRPYNPGDDLRSMDWKVFGRTDRLVVKQYEEQTNVQATIVMDQSASMGFSHSGRMSKLDYAKTMAAAIGYVVVSQSDAIGLLSASTRLPAGSQLGHLSRLYESLEKLAPNGAWDIDGLVRDLEVTSRRRGFVAVFSDLMADPERVLSSLRLLHARKNEVLVFQVLDPAELDLPFNGPILFEDMEDGTTLKTEPDTIRGAYRSWVKDHLASQSQAFRSLGVDYLLLTTDSPFDRGLGAYLSWRQVHL